MNNAKMKVGCEDASECNFVSIMFCRSGKSPDSDTGALIVIFHYENRHKQPSARIIISNARAGQPLWITMKSILPDFPYSESNVSVQYSILVLQDTVLLLEVENSRF